jgi:hypothetical protein
MGVFFLDPSALFDIDDIRHRRKIAISARDTERRNDISQSLDRRITND